MYLLKHLLGLDNSNGVAYLFWSGIGGYILVLITAITGFIKAHKQRERHHQQLKDHIDYKFAKLTDEEEAKA